MWFWFPWKFFLRNLARRQGFLDPIELFSRLSNFAQPAEVVAPTELLRSGAILHARGLINSAAIQHNLDWVWPYWVECQFDPNSESFVPRAFSITQINLTQRNWTAVGLPDAGEYPIVDPRGLVTPLYDGWSLDCWIIQPQGENLIPSRLAQVNQVLSIERNLQITTEAKNAHSSIVSKVEVLGTNENPVCQISYKGLASQKALLVVSLRPYNPEGVTFINDIKLLKGRQGWKVDNKDFIYFSEALQQVEFSYYRKGDVFSRLPSVEDKDRTWCKVGLATSAAIFELTPGQEKEVTLQIPLKDKKEGTFVALDGFLATQSWEKSLETSCDLNIPDKHFEFLYKAAVKTLILHSPKEVYPGPYTYRRFWFRDAAFILYAMTTIGLKDRVERALNCFSSRQTQFGYFLSQEGEWDSNGEALWIYNRFCELTNQTPRLHWKDPIYKAAQWIMRKRLSSKLPQAHRGLFPAGFSAEHLGPNDYYYWDNFWGVAGLRAAASLSRLYQDEKRRKEFSYQADQFMEVVEQSLAQTEKRLGRKAIPASPYRRLDTSAIGSMPASYPLQIFSAYDDRIFDTAQFLVENCLVHGGFFHDMTHSGINPYLTLHIAQVFLRKGDSRYFDLMKSVANLATSTGQWPEAIHPRTKGGCMGDGQHVWAAAEWVMMIRNCFVREEEKEGTLVLCSGIPEQWINANEKMSFGPTNTLFGSVSVVITPREDHVTIEWDAAWHRSAPRMEIRLPGFPPQKVSDQQKSLTLKRGASA